MFAPGTERNNQHNTYMKKITCKCGHQWYVEGQRVPWSNKRRVDKALLVCRQCGTQNTLKHPAQSAHMGRADNGPLAKSLP